MFGEYGNFIKFAQFIRNELAYHVSLNVFFKNLEDSLAQHASA